jgi:VWFA-related protein
MARKQAEAKTSTISRDIRSSSSALYGWFLSSMSPIAFRPRTELPKSVRPSRMCRAFAGPISVLSLAAFAIALSALRITPLHAQEASPVFQATTELVLVDVQVLHKRTNTPAGSLHAGDFRIFEDGVAQQIRHFSRDELPLSVVLLFDLTASVHGPLKRLSQEAKGALDRFKPQDEVAVMVYGESARLVDGFSRDRDRNARAIEQAAAMTTGEEAYFNEAVYQAAGKLRESSMPSSRPLIIWLTDNIPDFPDSKHKPVHTEDDAVRALHETGVVVAPLLLRDAKYLPLLAVMSPITSRMARSHPPGDARKYAEWTGGQVIGLHGKEPGQRLGEMIDGLRARYALGYRPGQAKPVGTFCKLHLELAPDGALRPTEWIVLARQGYYRR